MSRERSGREGIKKAAGSPNSSATMGRSTGKPTRSKKIKWETMKVFDQPEFTVPFGISMYKRGKKPQGIPGPELWMQAAIESGLVAMGSFDAAEQKHEMYKPSKDHPPQEMNKSLDQLLDEGIADTLAKLEKL